MKLGGETWKWALVVILLAVFILVANQAYRAVNNPEDQFAPPDDYMKGDSFDIERNPGPGAGQPVDVPGTGSPAPAVSPAGTPETPGTQVAPASTEPIERPVVDWNELKSPTPAANPAPEPVPAPAEVPAGN